MEYGSKQTSYSKLVILGILLSVVNSEKTITIVANNPATEYALVDYLCGDQNWQITNQTTIALDPTVKHVIPQREQLCVVHNKQDLILQSSSQSEQAVVSCANGEAMTTHTGFRFVNLFNLTIRNVRFENCGGIINDTTLAPSGTSPENAIQNKQQAVLVLSICTNVNIVNVTISVYHGYAVFAVNLFGDIQIQRMTVTDSISAVRQMTSSDRNDLLESGSGAIFHFNDDNDNANRISRVYIKDSTTFTNNYNIYPQYLLKSLQATRVQNQPRDFPISGAGGLSFHLEQQQFRVQVFVEDTEFSNNGGSTSGGALMYSHNTINNADISFRRCIFTNNTVDGTFSDYFGGGGLQLFFIFSYFDLPMVMSTAGVMPANISIENSSFLSHSGSLGAAVSVYNEAQNVKPIKIKFSQLRFIDNEATEDGDCILVRNERSAYYREQPLNIHLESIEIVHNGKSSITDASSALSFIGVPFVTITGSESSPGTISNGENRALRAYNTNVFLSGTLSFSQNAAAHGGAIALRANSHLFFVEPANILFLNNTATISGGAIHSDFISGIQCVLQFITPGNNYSNTTDTIQSVSKLKDLNFNIQFVDNTAMDGNSVYAQPLYYCSWYSESVVQISSNLVDSVYEELFHFTVDGKAMQHTSEMRSYPNIPCFCHNETSLSRFCDSNSNQITVDTYPGKSFTVHMIAVDSQYRSLRTLIQTQVSETSGEFVSFQKGSQQQILINEVLGRECSKLEYTLYSSDNRTVKLNIGIPSTGSQTIQVEINLQTCPLGFKVNQGGNSCECVQVFSEKKIKCDIETSTFNKIETVWIGPTDYTDPPAPAYTTRCPEGYCKQETTVRLNETNSISQADRCQGHRTGEVCGKCIAGYSMRFGTNKCYANCFNYYLFTIPIYILAGILLVFLLFLLKISTASGTLIVVLYYAQLVSINLGLLIQTDETRFAYIFISLLNLELGFPLCFYEGMTFIGKQWLQYVFPVYLWLLVALLTILSRFSTRLSNLIGSECIKVFVTLMYLSYTKILRTAFSVLVPTYVRTDEQSYSVWFFDGTEKFLSGNHLYLAIVSIAFLVFIIAPYKIFLFSAQWLLRSSWVSTRFKPLIDASLAPFKDRYRFWFGLRLIIIAVLVIVAIFFTPSYPDVVTYVHLVIILFLTVTQAYIKPYKSKVVNILDIFFLVNYCLFLIGCLFVFSGVFGSTIDDLIPYIAAVELIAIGTTFIVFVGVIIYHIAKRVKGSEKMSFELHSSDKAVNKTSKDKSKESESATQYGRESIQNLRDQNVTSFNEMDKLREPLLDDDEY